MGETRMRRAEMIDRPAQIHPMLQRRGAACQRATSAFNAPIRSRNVVFSRSMYMGLLH